MFFYIFNKYAWVVLLKDIKGITITIGLQIFVDKLGHKPIKYAYMKVAIFTIEQWNLG